MANGRESLIRNRLLRKRTTKRRIAPGSSQDKSLQLETLETRMLLSLTAEAGGPYIIAEGEDLHLDGSSSEINPDLALFYYWDMNNNDSYTDTVDLTGESPSIPWSVLESYGVHGDNTTEYTIGLKVEWDVILANTSDTDTATVKILNTPPTADAGGPYAVDKGEGITLDASDSYDPNANDTLSYNWDLDNDGAFDDATGVTESLSWSDLQSLGLENVGDAIHVGVKVTDDVGDDSDHTFVIVVNNEPPVANAGGPYSIGEGQDLQLNANSTSDPDGDKLAYLWDLDGDGVFDDAAGKNPLVPWETLEALALPSNGTNLRIRLMTLDGDPGGYDFDSARLRIHNRDPHADADGPYVRNEGRGIWLDASNSTDPDANDDLSYQWRFRLDAGDPWQTIYAGPSPIVRIPWNQWEALGVTGDGDPSFLRLIVRDNEGGQDGNITTITFKNVAPVADNGGPYTILEGEDVTLRAGGSYDVNDNDSLSYRWSIGDENGWNQVGTQKNQTVSWATLAGLGLADDGTSLQVRLKVTDSDGGESVNKDLLLVIQNAAPEITAVSATGENTGGPGQMNEGDNLKLSVTATDPGGDDLMVLWDIDGDGVYDDASGVNPIVPWAYIEQLVLSNGEPLPSDGTSIPIDVMVFDGEEQGFSYGSTDLVIHNLNPVADANGPYWIREGEGLWLNASDSNDPNANDEPLTYEWDINGVGFFETFAGNSPIKYLPWEYLQVLAAVGMPTDGSKITMRLRVTDSDGAQDVTTATLRIFNEDPVADAGGPYTILEGKDLWLYGGHSYDVNKVEDNRFNPLNYAWDLDSDKDYDDANGKFVHLQWSDLVALGLHETWDDGTSLEVGLKVTDSDGGSDKDRDLLLVIQNVAPTADAGGPYTINEGESLQLDATGSSDPGQDPLEFLWDLDGNGVHDDAAGESPLVPWETLEALGLPSDGSTQAISVRVDDGEEHGVSYARASLTIDNLAPIPDAGGPYSILEGRPLWVDACGTTDPDSNDNLVYAWDIHGDGIVDYFAGPNPIAHIPWYVLENAGVQGDGIPVRLRLIVGDQEGNGQALRAHEDVALTVYNVNPTTHVGGPYVINEGQALDLQGFGYDPNRNDYRLRYEWDLNNDGVYDDAFGRNPAPIPWATLQALVLPTGGTLPDDGTSLVVGLKVTDQDGGVGIHRSLAWVVNNLAPRVSAGGPYVINEGDPLPLRARAADPGEDLSELTFLWDLDNDGVYDDAAGHTNDVPWEALEELVLPSDGTTQTIGLKVYDGEEGGFNYASADLIINNLAPIPDAGGLYVINEGRPLWVDARGTTDPDGNDNLVYAWDIYADGIVDYFAGADPVALIPWQVLENAGVPGDGIPIPLRLIVGDLEGNGQAKRAQDDVSLIVNNVDPDADANGPYVINEGSGVQLIGSNSSDPNANDILTHDWDLNDDGTFDILGQTNPFVTWVTLHDTFGLASDGTSLVLNLRVSDNHGGVDNDRVLLLVVNNLAPSVEAGGDYIINEGDDLPLNGSGSDPGQDPLTFLWDLDNDGAFDDASTTSPLVPWDHLKLLNLNTNGQSNTIALLADDGEEGGQNIDTATLIINNVAPTANAGPDHEINEGDTAHFFGSFLEPYGDLDGPFSFAWNFGDGSPIANADHAAHTYIDNGVFNVNFSVTDKDGGTGSDQAIVTVLNVAPDVDAGEDKVTSEGELVPFSGKFTDPGLNDIHKVTWDFGDGTMIAGTFGDLSLLDVRHTYADDGEYTVTLTIEDDDGGIGTDTLTVIVFNEGPWVYAGPDHGIDEGDTVSFDIADFSDVLADIPPASITWNFGDGSPLLIGDLNPTHTYADDGVYVARLTIDDGDGGVVFDEATIIASNVAPIINAGPDALANMDEPFFFSGAATDPGGANDPLTFLWDFGDGTAADGTLIPSHTYTESGLYTVRLTVADDDGGVTTDTLQVTVQQLLPIVNNSTFVHTLAGLVKVKLTGPGELVMVSHVAGTGIDLNTVELNDTTEKSSLVIQTKGPKSFANLGDVNVHSSLGKLKGNTTNLKGTVQIDTGSLGKAQLASIQEQGSINVLSDIDQVKVKTNLEGTVNSGSAIGKVIGNKGALTGTIRAADNIGTVKFNSIEAATVSAGDNIEKAISKTSIVDSQFLAGYDIGSDALPGTADDLLNPAGATIGKVKVHATKGNFNDSYALAGVQPFDFTATTRNLLAPNPADQVLASFGSIDKATVGQVFLNGDPGAGIYGLFAATEPIANVSFTEVGAAGAPDFESRWTWF